MWISRLKLVVAYDGTDFSGWAAQPGRRTVQGTLKEAVRRVSGEDCEIVGASRTDSGAHAEGQVCHFDTSMPIEPHKWAAVLNRVLPRDVRVLESRKVHPEFHSRFWAVDREYLYVFYTGTPDPRKERYALWLPKAPNVVQMRRAAKAFEGDHDFRALTEELGPEVVNTRRRVFRATVGSSFGEIRFGVRGTAFLKGMVRRMAGCVLEVGMGKRPVSDVEALLDPIRRDGMTWPVVLPAKGLTLVRVRYGRHPRDVRNRDGQLLEDELEVSESWR